MLVGKDNKKIRTVRCWQVLGAVDFLLQVGSPYSAVSNLSNGC